MPEHLETLQDFQRAFDMPSATTPASQEAPSPKAAAPVPSNEAFPLWRSYELKGVAFKEIALRAPRGHEFWDYGDPVEWQAVHGQLVRVENLIAIRGYAERCASIPGETSITGAEIVEALDMRDTIALRKAVMRFFRVPEKEGSA